MQYFFRPETQDQVKDFRREAAYVVAILSGLSSDYSRRSIAREIDWGRLYQREAKGDMPPIAVEHYTGCDTYCMRIGMNGTTPEHRKDVAHELVNKVLGKYLVEQ